jgi:hypothetical protein
VPLLRKGFGRSSFPTANARPDRKRNFDGALPSTAPYMNIPVGFTRYYLYPMLHGS